MVDVVVICMGPVEALRVLVCRLWRPIATVNICILVDQDNDNSKTSVLTL